MDNFFKEPHGDYLQTLKGYLVPRFAVAISVLSACGEWICLILYLFILPIKHKFNSEIIILTTSSLN